MVRMHTLTMTGTQCVPVAAAHCGPSHPISQVLWPFLLEFVKPMEYTEAFGILTRCIAHIGGKKRDSDADDYFINFDEQGELWSFSSRDGALWRVGRVLWA